MPVWQAEVPEKGRMIRLVYSYEEGYTTEQDEYIVENGEIVLNMGCYTCNCAEAFAFTKSRGRFLI